MFDLIRLTFQVFQNCGFLDNVVGKLFPLHISVSIDIDLIKQICQVPYQRNISIRRIYFPELEMPFGNDNKFLQI
jgi:hypothetical protein